MLSERADRFRFGLLPSTTTTTTEMSNLDPIGSIRCDRRPHWLAKQITALAIPFAIDGEGALLCGHRSRAG